MSADVSDPALQARALEIIELTGCSRETAMMAARDVPPPADIEDAVDVVLGLMSCMHPRPLGSADPTAKQGVHDLARPYAASVGPWALAEQVQCNLVLRGGRWDEFAAEERPAGKNTLLLHDGVTVMVPRMPALPSCDELPQASEECMSLLVCNFALVTQHAGGDVSPPTMLYVRLRPTSAVADEEAIAPAAWSWSESDAGERRGARLILPLRRGVRSGECLLSLEPPANDHGFDASMVPTVRVSWGTEPHLGQGASACRGSGTCHRFDEPD